MTILLKLSMILCILIHLLFLARCSENQAEMNQTATAVSAKIPVTRTNFCPLHKKVEQGEIERKYALRGQVITVALTQEIDRANPYLAARVLDEVAKRAQFTYIPYVTGSPVGNETWTDVLLRTTEQYDLAIEWYMLTIERLSKGVIYPESWYNADTILIMKKTPPNDAFVFWAFGYPFDRNLWILTVVTIVLTGMLFYFFDIIHCEADEAKMFSTLEGCLFTSFYSYAGSRNLFKPKSRASCVLIISMAFLYLSLISSYTANLTNYFIIKGTSPLEVKDMEDAVNKNLLLCVGKGFASTDMLMEMYPKARFLGLYDDPDIMTALSEGKCDAGVISIEGYEIYKRDKKFNTACDVEWVGRRIFVSRAGFALQDSGQLCASFLDMVLHYHIVQMKDDGAIDDVLQLNRESITEPSCERKVKDDDEEKAAPLTVLNLGGAFIFHFLLVSFSILISLFNYFKQSKEVKEAIKEELKSSVANVGRRLSYISSFIILHFKHQQEGKKTENEAHDAEVSETNESSSSGEYQTTLSLANDCNNCENIDVISKNQTTLIESSSSKISSSSSSDAIELKNQELIHKLLERISEQAKVIEEQNYDMTFIKEQIIMNLKKKEQTDGH